MNSQRDSFIFYRSFSDAIKELDDADQLTLFRAITNYALDDIEPEISGVPKAMFMLVRPILGANRQRWENGNKGGRPSKVKAEENQTETEIKPNDNQTESKPKGNKDKDKDKDKNNGEFDNSPSEFLFENVWNIYERKGHKKVSQTRWDKLSTKNKRLALANIPLYIQSNPEKAYRLNFEKYLNQEVWDDELLPLNTNTKESNTNESNTNPAYRLL